MSRACRQLTKECDGLADHAALRRPHFDGIHIVDFTTEWGAGDALPHVGDVNLVFSSHTGAELHSEGLVALVLHLRTHGHAIGTCSREQVDRGNIQIFSLLVTSIEIRRQ